ncbi:hypothetical protein [Streptomyces antarcticus]|uniref:hypothetical protein n=1 Tax=Streptomyces antarcticus TaxID=2996458 RepID=UPI00226E05AA|nr:MULTISPECIES: hypothetical protein [unclassified Streptomyces]MCY0942495.1 hypothetical protein [Streptomyces sp. H34-AA3]MCZ4083814.1 hypothetical protein [Streptomyces sp. H34-S5]
MNQPGLSGLHPTCCRNHDPDGAGTVCGQRLDQQEGRTRLFPSSALVDLQTRLDSLLSPDVDPAQAFETFANFQVVTAIVLATWPSSAPMMNSEQAAAVEEHLASQSSVIAKSGHRPLRGDAGVTWAHLPRSPVGTAAVLSVADQLLHSPSMRKELTELTGKIPDRTAKRWATTWKILKEEASPDCRTQVEEALPWSRQRRLSSSAPWTRNRIIPSLMTTALDKQHTYVPENIPQELPDRWFRIFLNDPVIPITARTRRLRRTIAIQLIQASTDMNSEEAIEYLGIPPGMNALDSWNTEPVLHALCDDTVRLRAGITRLAEHLASLPLDGRVNYRHRRQHCASWHLSAEAFDALHAQLTVAPTRLLHPRPERLHKALSAIIWRRVTKGEYCLAPCFWPPFGPARRIDATTAEISLARRIERAGPQSPYQAILPMLERHANSLLTTCDPSG